jgi:hypothetical protein
VFEFEFNVNVFVVVTNVDEICPIQFAFAMSYPTKLNMPCPVQLSLELKNFYRKHSTMPSQLLGTHRLGTAGGPRRHVLVMGPAGVTTPPRPSGGTRWWDHDSRWYRSQTINDDLVLLLYDDPFHFVIILCAKATSLVTNDEPEHFVIECSQLVTKVLIVTTASSQISTFLVVPGGRCATGH